MPLCIASDGIVGKDIEYTSTVATFLTVNVVYFALLHPSADLWLVSAVPVVYGLGPPGLRRRTRQWDSRCGTC